MKDINIENFRLLKQKSLEKEMNFLGKRKR